MWQKRLPNIITISRIAFVPLIVLALYYEEPYGGIIAAALFILASIGDWLDGYLARLFHVESLLGKFMDPISDKILVTSTLVMMIPTKGIHPVLVILLLMRDTLINGLRSVAASENIIIAAGQMGKWKTALQMVAIPAVLIEVPVAGLPTYEIGIVGLWLSVILSMVSGTQYVLLFIRSRS
ncbi:MAG: CDP-diacylglycerol--glycerol-3-phosphate 3-phosphatidyltransferase [Bdellovibrionales bacterium]